MLLSRRRRPLVLIATDATRRLDPTNTTPIRKRWERELVRKFRQLQTVIRKAIVIEDVFGMRTSDAVAMVSPGAKRFAFGRSSEKINGFMDWLRSQEELGILETIPGTDMQHAADASWMNVYIDGAYQRGIRDASARLTNTSYGSTDLLQGAFNQPIHADAVGIIYTRSYNELTGITDAMDQQISRELAAGMVDGRGVVAMARSINDRVEGIGIERARVLARTETIAAHAEGSLNLFAEAGVEGVTVEAEFTTAGDDAVCPECEDLEGQVFTIDAARGIIPVHPNCRCAFIPLVQDEPRRENEE